MKIERVRVGIEMTLKLFPDRQDYQFYKPLVEFEARVEDDDPQEVRRRLWEQVRLAMGEQIDSVQKGLG